MHSWPMSTRNFSHVGRRGGSRRPRLPRLASSRVRPCGQSALGSSAAAMIDALHPDASSPSSAIARACARSIVATDCSWPSRRGARLPRHWAARRQNRHRAAGPFRRNPATGSVPARPIRGTARLSMVVESEQGYAPDDRGCEPPPRVEHDHRGSRDEDDDASHCVAPAVEGISRLRINRSVSLSFSGIAAFSRQSWAPRVLRMSARSTETSFSLLPPTAAMWYSTAIPSQRSSHEHVHDEHHRDPSDPDAPQRRHVRRITRTPLPRNRPLAAGANATTCAQYHRPRAKPPKAMRPMRAMMIPSTPGSLAVDPEGPARRGGG